MNNCDECNHWHEHANQMVGDCFVEGMPHRVMHGGRSACDLFECGPTSEETIVELRKQIERLKRCGNCIHLGNQVTEGGYHTCDILTESHNFHFKRESQGCDDWKPNWDSEIDEESES